MFKNVSLQKLTVFAWDVTTNLPKTGLTDIVVYIQQDGGTTTALTDVTATEQSSSHAKGYYDFDITQAETNANKIVVTAESPTANVQVIGAPAVIFTRAANSSTLLIDANGRVDVGKHLGQAVTLDANNALNVSTKWVAGTAQTARDLGASVLVGDKTGFSLSSAGVQAVWDALTSALTTAGSVGKRIADNLDVAVSTRCKPIETGTAQSCTQTTLRLKVGSIVKTSANGMKATVAWDGGGGGVENQIIKAFDPVNLDCTFEGTLAGTPSGTITYILESFGGVLVEVTDLADNADVTDIENAIAVLQTAVADLQARLPAALTTDGNIKADALRVAGTAQTGSDLTAGQATLISGQTTIGNNVTNIQGRLPAALTGAGNMKADALAVAGTVQTGRDLGAGVLVSDKTGFSLSSAGIQAIWDALTSALTTAGSIGKRIADNLDVVLSTRATPAQVNAEMLDVLTVDTYAEPGQGVVPTTASLKDKINYIFKRIWNKSTQDGTTTKVYNAAGTTVDHKISTSDDNTTFTRATPVSGP
jgi:hypothetical protein